MFWERRINSKKFSAGTTINLGLAFWFAYPSWTDFLVLGYVVVASALNQFFMVLVFSQLFQGRLGEDNAASKKKVLINFGLKTFFLLSAFIVLTTFSRDYVLHGMVLYTFQLIILCLSIKNIGQFF